MNVEASGRDWQQYAINLKARAVAAEPHVTELEAALRKLAGWNNWNGQDVQDIARAALAAPTKASS